MATPSAQMNLSGLARRLVNDGLLSDADAQKAQETTQAPAKSVTAQLAEDSTLQATNVEGIFLTEQPIKLTTITLKLGAGIECLAEDFLDIADMGADAGFTAQHLVKVRCRGQVISVYMSLKYPLNRQIIATHVLNDLVG